MTELAVKWIDLTKNHVDVLLRFSNGNERGGNNNNANLSLTQADTSFWNVLINEKIE